MNAARREFLCFSVELKALRCNHDTPGWLPASLEVVKQVTGPLYTLYLACLVVQPVHIHVKPVL